MGEDRQGSALEGRSRSLNLKADTGLSTPASKRRVLSKVHAFFLDGFEKVADKG